MQPPRYPQIWQCVGMIVGVYGIGYLVAARSPYRHWPIVLVGLLGKILGPIGFLQAALTGTLPWLWGTTILTNDLLWWIPFTAILYGAFRFHTAPSHTLPELSWSDAMREVKSHRGASLGELSRHQPLLVVFLRHAGCTFCREAMADLARQRPAIERQGVKLAIVHMSSPLNATQTLARYGLDDVHRFSDPECRLYEAFGLSRGRFSQLFGPSVWMRGTVAGVLEGHGIGMLEGDGFRMPGVFLLRDGRIVAEFRGSTAADRPDYIGLACAAEFSAERPPAATYAPVVTHRLA
jgi:peroxiredoxin